MQDFYQQSIKPNKVFRANTFTLPLPDGWQDKTVYTLTGPVTDGIQHNIIVNVDYDVPLETVVEFAEWQMKGMENELKGCRLLKKGKTYLANGLPAFEAIYRWYPTDALRIYQHQIFVLFEKRGYKLTATFTKKTRKTIGPEVERIMRSFNPLPHDQV